MRNQLSTRKVIQLRKKLNMPNIVWASVRGGEDHTISIGLEDRSVLLLFKDGTIIESKYKWERSRTFIEEMRIEHNIPFMKV